MKSRSAIFAAAVVAVVLALLPAGGAAAAPEEIRTAFAEGNALYEEGEYEDAVAAYVRAVDAGAVDAALQYNLGNAYYQAGYMGYAVIAYERALQLSPRLPDARENLKLVRSLLRDSQFVPRENLPRRMMGWVSRRLNLAETMVVTTVLYFVFAALLVAFVLRRSALVGTVYRWLSWVSPGRLFGLEMTHDLAVALAFMGLLLAGGVVTAVDKYDEVKASRDGVVVTTEAAVYGGPSEESTLQFNIHEGTKLRVADSRPGWIQINLPGDLTGWVDAASVERI